jgi:hypothetical protein
MPGKKLFPLGLPGALRHRFQAMLLKNVGDGAASDLMSKVGECPYILR